jgi:translation elongation factor P/translation initiation factor 5A
VDPLLIDRHSQATTALSGISRAIALEERKIVIRPQLKSDNFQHTYAQIDDTLIELMDDMTYLQYHLDELQAPRRI